MPTRADLLACALLAVPATTIVFAYVFGVLAGHIWPAAAAALAGVTAVALLALWRRAMADTQALLAFVSIFAATAALLLAREWPQLLPGGGGPDLTHHLMLIDYVQQHEGLVTGRDATYALGEMADYTPGVHILSAVVASLMNSDGLFTIYPVVAFSVALKFAVLGLIVWRLIANVTLRAALVLVTLALLALVPSLTLSSFTHDSFLAQVVSELFAVAMLWMLVEWSARPSWWSVATFGLAAAAAYLTWPVWIGPLLIALALTLGVATRVPFAVRARHGVVAVAPMIIVAGLHAYGRTGAAAIVGASGAVALPSLTTAAALLSGLALVGIYVARHDAAARVIAWLCVGIAAQAIGLWIVARANDAATPYMAIKMTYLAVYPMAVAAALGIGAIARSRLFTWMVAVTALSFAAAGLQDTSKPPPVVDADLFAAGVWARTHLPASCVDYLVANEYTAYWLHLAVLRNARHAQRSADDSLYLTDRSFARWVEDGPTPPYAIARRSVLPAEIRDRTRIRYVRGDALVIERINSKAAVVDDTCVASPPAAGS